MANNSSSQKSFRQRKQQHVEALEVRKKELEHKLKHLQQENQQLQLSLSLFNPSRVLNPEASPSLPSMPSHFATGGGEN